MCGCVGDVNEVLTCLVYSCCGVGGTRSECSHSLNKRCAVTECHVPVWLGSDLHCNGLELWLLTVTYMQGRYCSLLVCVCVCLGVLGAQVTVPSACKISVCSAALVGHDLTTKYHVCNLDPSFTMSDFCQYISVSKSLSQWCGCMVRVHVLNALRHY